ncbi:phosphoglucosamine mutase [Erysipelothrix urinaevulpis]|uniref:phosphoglucosamine mutase n=1 Tax=Erysipelothrix urinaevulpis TaxID=2683717 RepID=UPI001F2E1E96|nr:phosphoglucosamine mutase [Erysipelothrix urinaevulpis]
MIGFGTDGIRGQFNTELTVEIAVKLGEFLGNKNKGKRILIGEDTRISSPILAKAVAVGASSMGANVYLMGVCPTPALAYVIPTEKFAAGVMISASHNPYYDNGLKVFNQQGMKLTLEEEAEIEQYIQGETQLVRPISAEVAKIIEYPQGLEHYIKHIESFTKRNFSGLRVVLDCANGSSISTAEQIFTDLGADVLAINTSADGFNINENCGSTHINVVRDEVIKHQADFGFAFDGDADRCLAVDGRGNIIDGDKLLYVLAKDMMQDDTLKDNTVVTTVMANLGFMKSCEKLGIHVEITDVGDKYVFEAMHKNDYKLGGEQSGHVILKDFATTGDGVLTALKVTDIMVKNEASLEELTKDCATYPQVLEKVMVENKHEMMELAIIQDKIKEIETNLGDDGRVLVRPSGTEPVIRVMVEAKEHELCQKYVNDMIKVINNI